MEISGKGLLHFDLETSSLIGNQTYHRTNMFSPYQPNSCYEPDYECICIMINGKTCSVPLNILSSAFVYSMNLAVLGLHYQRLTSYHCSILLFGENTAFFIVADILKKKLLSLANLIFLLTWLPSVGGLT